ncbi:MAG TPA: hypothetical protein GX702_10410 [Chloroflexi bacterium]|nr:hypothetical protein [Chloroflexota bacterium]
MLSDVISPLTADLLDLVNGPSHTFFVDANSGWSGWAISNILTSHGIRVWGKMVVMGDIMFTVRRAQARWAQYLLERAGVPIKPEGMFCAPLFPPFQDTRQGGIWDTLGRAFDRLMDCLGL